MKTRGYFTIEYIPEAGESAIPPAVIEFDEFTLSQNRPVKVVHSDRGEASALVPDPVTTTTICGTKAETEMPL